MNTQAILDQLLLVVLNISFWNGRKALSTSELTASGIDVGTLPQGTIATLESKQIVPPETVKVFAALKREAIALLMNSGIHLGWGEGYAIPRDNCAELLQELKRVKDEFEGAKANYLSQYEQEINKWVGSHSAKQIPVIRSLVQSASYIHDAIHFNYAAFEVKAPAQISNNCVDSEVSGLFTLLCQDIRVTAHNSVEADTKAERQYFNIRGFAAKAGEHVLRLACVLTCVNDPDNVSEIPLTWIESAIRIVEYHLSETQRLFNVSQDSPELKLAEKCLDWLRVKYPVFSLTEIYQEGPMRVRTKDAALSIVKILEAHGWVTQIQGGATINYNKHRQAWKIVG